MRQAVIFDVGNVLLRWDPRLLYRQLLPDEAAIDAFFAEADFHAWNLEFDRGRGWDEGVAELAARLPHRAELVRAFHHRWHDTLPGAIEGSVAILEALDAAGAPLFAITNFSGEKWAETRARFAFLGRFRDVVVSGHERLVKPDPAIYRLCLERNGLAATDCVFVDDSPANVATAAALGIDAICFTGPEALAAELARRGLP
jgi:2-haloacid dehalogenase